MPNCIFYSFKISGKLYAARRGMITRDVFGTFEHAERRKRIVAANEGSYPGLSTDGSDFVFVVIPDYDVTFGSPIMLYPESFAHA